MSGFDDHTHPPDFSLQGLPKFKDLPVLDIPGRYGHENVRLDCDVIERRQTWVKVCSRMFFFRFKYHHVLLDLQARLLVFLEPVKKFRKICSSLNNRLTFLPIMTVTIVSKTQCSLRKEVIRLSFIDELTIVWNCAFSKNVLQCEQTLLGTVV